MEATQYLRPDGRKKIIHAEFPKALEPKWNEVKDAKLNLEVEVLMTREVSWTLNDHDYGDYAVIVCANDEHQNEKVAEMISNFDRTDYDKWIRAHEGGAFE